MVRVLRIICLGLLLCLVTVPVIAAKDNPAETRDVFAAGKYVYVAGNGLQIFDYTNWRNPSLIASLVTPGTANGIFVEGNFAYLAAGNAGLQIINISSFAQLKIIGSVNTAEKSGAAKRVFVRNGYAFVIDESLYIVDVSNPSNPVLVSKYPSFSFWSSNAVRYTDVFVLGNYAYLTSEKGGLEIVDVSNPKKPVSVGLDSNPQLRTYSVCVKDGLAYVAAGVDGLLIYDVVKPAKPVLIRSYNGYFHGGEVGSCNDVYLGNNNVYMTDQQFGLVIVDVSKPAKPIEHFLKDFTPPTAPKTIFYQNDYIFVADGVNGLVIYNLKEQYKY